MCLIDNKRINNNQNDIYDKNKKLKFACGITLYNPDEFVCDRVIEYISSFDKVFVFDNSDNGEHEYLSIFNSFKDIIYMGGNGNYGLPYAYNSILSCDEIKDIDFLCTIDQDSIFSKEDISAIKKYIKKIDINKIAIVGPYINYYDDYYVCKNDVIDKSWVITSGAFLNLSLIRERNIKYDENYFIDKFEIDLCKQLIDSGFIIQMYMGAELKQKLGSESGHKHPNHSPLRHRYLFRNRFYFNHKFYGKTKRWTLNILQTFRHLILIVFFEEKKFEKINVFFLACQDYKSGKLGKIE